jgi:hypothetical protein
LRPTTLRPLGLRPTTSASIPMLGAKRLPATVSFPNVRM